MKLGLTGAQPKTVDVYDLNLAASRIVYVSIHKRLDMQTFVSYPFPATLLGL